jgi:hypothetical protein
VFASLGRFVYRRRVPVVLAWVLVLGVGLTVGGQVFGRLVTSAAALIVVVFLGFAAGELLTIKEVGLGEQGPPRPDPALRPSPGRRAGAGR